MKRNHNVNKSGYSQLKHMLYLRLIGLAVIAFIIILALYTVLWRGRGGDEVVGFFQNVLKLDSDNAHNLYQQVFRNYLDMIWIAAVIIVFFVLLYIVLGWFTKYFDIVIRGIDELTSDSKEIQLPQEMATVERKLNAVKAELEKRAVEAQIAEQKKNDLVMYLAHDIRTPLTSVIGYLNLLDEAPDMPEEQRTKYIRIGIDKAYRLEKMVNEFFEITRYNMQQISICKDTIDLYYMLVQLSDELSPMLSKHGNTISLNADESITAYADPDKLARVFNNILKNAVAYSYPNTEITIAARKTDGSVVVSFENMGKTMPQDALRSVFDRFYRADDARSSNTGGTGLGLAIAKEIVDLHNGTITAESKDEHTIFKITLPDGT